MVEKFFGVWKSAWKTCITPTKSSEKSTFPRMRGVEKWKKLMNFTQMSKIEGVEK